VVCCCARADINYCDGGSAIMMYAEIRLILRKSDIP